MEIPPLPEPPLAPPLALPLPAASAPATLDPNEENAVGSVRYTKIVVKIISFNHCIRWNKLIVITVLAWVIATNDGHFV